MTCPRSHTGAQLTYVQCHKSLPPQSLFFISATLRALHCLQFLLLGSYYKLQKPKFSTRFLFALTFSLTYFNVCMTFSGKSQWFSYDMLRMQFFIPQTVPLSPVVNNVFLLREGTQSSVIIAVTTKENVSIFIHKERFFFSIQYVCQRTFIGINCQMICKSLSLYNLKTLTYFQLVYCISISS